jgi:hypothetical protein
MVLYLNIKGKSTKNNANKNQGNNFRISKNIYKRKYRSQCLKLTDEDKSINIF